MTIAAKQKILLVDDNDVFRGALKIALEQEGYEIAVAENGKAAQDLVGLTDYLAVISDIRMAPVNGIELLQHIQRSKPTPVILMTGFSDLMEARQAIALGAAGFLPKPFKSADLVALLRQLDAGKAGAPLGTRSEARPATDADFSKLSIDDFVSGHEMRHDIYIRVSEAKYLKIAHQGEDMPMDQIRSYKTKGLTHLYMRREDFRAYLGVNLSMSRALKASASISRDKRMSFMKHTSELMVSQLFSEEISKEEFASAKTIVESTADLLAESDDLLDLLSLLNSHSDSLYAHSLGVSLYGVMIAKEMRWNSPANLYKVAIGGIFHDIGKKEIDRAILEKPRMKLSVDEVRLLESHPTRGLEILSQISSVPSDVLQIVSQHHENCLGTGYPARLKKNGIHPFARLIAVADEFCKLVVKNPDSVGIRPKEAIDRMMTLQKGTLDPTFLDALARVCGNAAVKESRTA